MVKIIILGVGILVLTYLIPRVFRSKKRGKTDRHPLKRILSAGDKFFIKMVGVILLLGIIAFINYR